MNIELLKVLSHCDARWIKEDAVQAVGVVVVGELGFLFEIGAIRTCFTNHRRLLVEHS